MGNQPEMNPKKMPAILILSIPVGIVLGAYLAVHYERPVLFLFGFLGAYGAGAIAFSIFSRLKPSSSPINTQGIVNPAVASQPDSEQAIVSDNKLPILAVVFGTLFLALAVVVLFTYLKMFWPVIIIGLAGSIGFWKHRQQNNGLGAMVFVSVLVTIYGVLGQLVLLLAK